VAGRQIYSKLQIQKPQESYKNLIGKITSSSSSEPNSHKARKTTKINFTHEKLSDIRILFILYFFYFAKNQGYINDKKFNSLYFFNPRDVAGL
jgi:hypothetical protein